jgi:hypothetical protein
MKELEREVRELRQANEILKKASVYFAQAELDRSFRKLRLSLKKTGRSSGSSRCVRWYSSPRPLTMNGARLRLTRIVHRDGKSLTLISTSSVNAGLKPHQLPEQKCATWQDLAGVKLRHFVGYRVVHGPARRSAPTERRSCVVLSRLRSGLSTHLCGLSFECQGAFPAER